ncbi:MAG: hypothetical protein MZV64_73365 [Ignavibacteriales bacterium]|nr:hypothetical protein [Ignavibacteriales bacterium]
MGAERARAGRRRRPGGEPRGHRDRQRTTALRHVEILPSEVPGLIDELPALAALATLRRRAHGDAAPASCA